MEGNFAMRRERDILEAVNRHARHVFRSIYANPPYNIYLKTRVYWTKNKATEIDSCDIPEYPLQEVLQDKCLHNILWDYGRGVASSPERPKNTAAGAKPIAVSISAETLLTSDIVPHEGKRKCKGAPILLVAGRTATGKQHIKLFPVSFLLEDEGKEKQRKMVGWPGPPELEKKIESVRALAEDFLVHFFDGYDEYFV